VPHKQCPTQIVFGNLLHGPAYSDGVKFVPHAARRVEFGELALAALNRDLPGCAPCSLDRWIS